MRHTELVRVGHAFAARVLYANVGQRDLAGAILATIFMSHSSRNDRLASEVETWLRGEGFDDVFVDHDSIRSGDKWTEALRRAKGACRVVLCLVTPDWLSSDECFGEFTAGWYLGRRMIPLLIVGDVRLDEKQAKRLSRVLGEDQGLDLSKCWDGERLDFSQTPSTIEPLKKGLRAAGALTRIGLDPYAFAVDQQTIASPFPGLQSFGDSDADAALFFGRSHEIALCLEDLREMRATGDRRAYAIQGASGSGKSSLMKAGVLPRLRREQGWLVTRSFRPGADPLYSFADAIARTAKDSGVSLAPGSIAERLLSSWRVALAAASSQEERNAALAGAVRAELAPIVARTNAASVTTLIAIDQGEELAYAEGEGAGALCDILAALLNVAWDPDTALPFQVVLTVRDDSFAELKASDRFARILTRTADIRTLPIWQYDNAIQLPAERYDVAIDTELVRALMEDAPERDALPLLAFAMRQIWMRFAAERRLVLSHYKSLGLLSGIMEDAAERAMRGMDPSDERPISAVSVSADKDELAARTFLPALVQVSENSVPIRRIADIGKFDEQQRALLQQFQRWYLVTTRENTVEVSHEAMFREWTRFTRWFAEARERLDTLRSVQSASAQWAARARDADYCVHIGKRLADALALAKTEAFASLFHELDHAYLSACVRAWSDSDDYAMLVEELRETRRARRELSNFFLGANLLAVVVLGFLGVGAHPSALMSLIIALILTCLVWHTANRYYTRLLAAKYDILYQVESHQEFQPFMDEWRTLPQGRVRRGFSIERVLPLIFVLGYLVFLVYQLSPESFALLGQYLFQAPN